MRINALAGVVGSGVLGTGIVTDSVLMTLLAGIILLATGNLPTPSALDSVAGMRDRAKRPE